MLMATGNEKYVERSRMLVLHEDSEWGNELQTANHHRRPIRVRQIVHYGAGHDYIYGALPYRRLQGVAEAMLPHMPIPDYPTIHRSINRLDIDIRDAIITAKSTGKSAMAVDTSGLKQHNRGECISGR